MKPLPFPPYHQTVLQLTSTTTSSFFFLLLLLLLHPASSTNFPPQLLALLTLKSSLNDPQSNLHDWDPTPLFISTSNSSSSSSSPHQSLWCSWSGITCNGTAVTSIDLSSRNLSGTIPPEIRTIKNQLLHLNLSSNSFSGPLPPAIFELSQLRTLDISHNDFNSTFPSGVSDLRYLRVLNCYSNSFTGPLPEDLGGHRYLESLNLGGSYFGGGIPASYGDLPRLRFLHLAGNIDLNGSIPGELGFLSQLEHMEIGYNTFSGGIPKEFSMLSSINYLDISESNVSGPLPPELGNLTSLENLMLFRNRLWGPIPSTFSGLKSLQQLDLSFNNLTGVIPDWVSELKELRLLNLMVNEFEGGIPEGIGELPSLGKLCLWNNSLNGTLPPRLGSNGNLSWLDVSANSLSGPLPDTLCNGNRLFKLMLFSNRFVSGLPASLANCTSLSRVRLGSNLLNGTIPYGFGRNLNNLTLLDLSNNNFSGPIPGDLGNAPKLGTLEISGNRFGTELPGNIWNAPSLQILSASRSGIVGKIPDFRGGCRSVYKIELDGNMLDGGIPWDISHCEKLILLKLKHNSLTGIIPWEISTLPYITDVDLSHNLLTGSIPSNFANVKTLESFNVSYNLLTGPIPSSGPIFPNLHPSSFVGNDGLCGTVLGKPCTSTTGSTSSDGQDGSGGHDHQPADKKKNSKLVWIMAVAFGIGIFVLIAGSRCFHANYGRYNSSSEDDKEMGGRPWKLTAFQRLNFSADDVLECLAINDKIIGIGSAGTVYRAEMPGGEIIAVKKLWAGKQKETNHRKRRGGTVLAEVDVLGNVRHRNIVRLLGCCSNKETTLLLYEYMPNGSLDDLLHGKHKGGDYNLVVAADWMTRYKIALGVAQGICYLHHDCDPVIVHRDLKPSNILLDAEMEARVADFGVAKLVQSHESMSVIAGSYGYIAPEYAYTLQVDEKSDIYSYGVVLMEILTGKRSVDREFGDGNSIVDWVRSKIKTKDGIQDILDKNAGASCSSVKEEMILVLRIALLCTSRMPADRPSMRDVVSMLQEAKPKRKSPGRVVDVGTGEGGGGGGGLLAASRDQDHVIEISCGGGGGGGGVGGGTAFAGKN